VLKIKRQKPFLGCGLRQQITACTNGGFTAFRLAIFWEGWHHHENDPERKNGSSISTWSPVLAIQSLSAEGHLMNRKALATLSPYLTRHLKRYGDYVVDLQNIPQPLEAIPLPIEIAETRCSNAFVI